MTDTLRPFSGYVPTSAYGARVAGPPGATLTAEQKAAASQDPFSFRHSAGRKTGCSQEEAMLWIETCTSEEALRPFDDAVVVYRQSNGELCATGILADLSLQAYDAGLVKKHENTIAKTQKRMAEYMATTRVLGNPPVTAVRPNEALATAIRTQTERDPDSSFTTPDGNHHQLWIVDGDAAEELCSLANTEIYITDGHHRLASASMVANDEARDDARIPVGVLLADELMLRSFARSVTDAELDADEVITRLEVEFEMEEVEADQAVPTERFEFGAKVGDRYFRLRVPREKIPDDLHASLNTNVLQDLILGPVFGIDDPRTDRRLQFVANLDDIPEACADADAWFLPYPLEASDVMAVADSDRTMPPKSTWFAPKLPSGLVIRALDE